MEPLFISTLVVAIAEIGDKTQLLAVLLATRFKKPWAIIAGILAATVANHLLAARFHSVLLVATGTTLGMMIADVPAVFLGEAATRIVPLKYVRWGSALIFAVLGLLALAQVFGLAH